MRIIIVGIGKVGLAITKIVCEAKHEVIVIDQNKDVIENVSNSFDVLGICGSACSNEVLKQAGANKCKIFIAATESDEANMLSCLLAKNLGAKFTIARIRDFEYTKQISILKEILGVSLTINPEKETSNEIINMINIPEAISVESFGHEHADLLEFNVGDNSPLIGMALKDVNSKLGVNVLVCAVSRNDVVSMPNANFVFKSGDKVHFTCNNSESRLTLTKFCLVNRKIKNVLIIGGGRISAYLAQQLVKNKYRVKLIEKNYERCKELNEILGGVDIVNADGTDHDILMDEGLNKCDAVVCLTGNDDANIIISMYANKNGVKKIICKVNSAPLTILLENQKNVSIVSTKDITVNRILSFVRATNNSRGNAVQRLYKLVNGQVEAVEFQATAKSKVLDKQFRYLHFKNNILIGAIIREGQVIIPNGESDIRVGDRVIVVTSGHELNDLDDII